jgi:hypothetical protein
MSDSEDLRTIGAVIATRGYLREAGVQWPAHFQFTFRRKDGTDETLAVGSLQRVLELLQEFMPSEGAHVTVRVGDGEAEQELGTFIHSWHTAAAVQ